MPWFKVDDQLHAHPKVVAAGNAAMGLWLRAGAWSAQQLTSGFVPYSLARQYGTQRNIQALINAGLWIEVSNGFKYKDWSDYQPSDDEVDDLRRKRSDAGKLGAAKRWGRRTDDDTHVMSEARHENESKLLKKNDGTTHDVSPVDNGSNDFRLPTPSERDARSESDGNSHGNSHMADDGKPMANGMANTMAKRCPDPDPVVGVKGSQSSSDRNAHENGGPDLTKIENELGQDVAWARRVVADVLGRAGPGVKDPTGYVLRSIRAEPARYQPTPMPPAFKDLPA